MWRKNPILPGFHPDPSICRVGEDYYLVNSTFAYFPGVPVYHSRDLQNFEQIGNVLNRKEQVSLNGCSHSEGIYAPTIRYHEGIFYMITTNVSGGGNFYVTAKDPAGPWSNPIFLGDQAAGIDPSLFFDDDGKCYYVGNRGRTPEGSYFGDCELYLQELDIEKGKLVGESRALFYGALKNAYWAEGPHIYKKDGWYYLMFAEGGTEENHSICIARSRNIWGPYENHMKNPIFTHRNLGREYPVQCTGHGDLIQDLQGNWYIVMLATRPENHITSLGRETFLAKVIWEDDWPVICPGTGRIEEGETQDAFEKKYHFDGKIQRLPFEFLTLRNPDEDMYHFSEKGSLMMKASENTLNDCTQVSYLSLRQTTHDFLVKTVFRQTWEEEFIRAGIAVVESNEFHLEYMIYKKEGQRHIQILTVIKGETKEIADIIIENDTESTLYLCSKDQKGTFYYMVGNQKICLYENLDLSFLSTEAAGGFVGCTIGMYVTTDGKKISDKTMDYVEYREFSIKGE